jgi:hypothetical protein
LVKFQDPVGEDVQDQPEDTGYQGNGYQEAPQPDWQALFNAPDFTQLIRPHQSRKAKEYQDKVLSVLKAGLVGSIRAGDFPDAAAIMLHGPGFASAAGQLADSSDRAANMIDLICSPASPLTMFLLTGLPLISQILRNHEEQLKQAPQSRRTRKAMRAAQKQADKVERTPRFTINILGRHIPIYTVNWPKWSKLLAGFRGQTQDPITLTGRVFTDPAVIRALAKQGIVLHSEAKPE